jgi:hypothetical protein
MKGKIDYALSGAAEAGNLNLFKYLEPRMPEYHKDDQIIHDICCKATFGGNLNIIKYLDETNRIDLLHNMNDEILDEAISSGSLDLVKYLMGYKLNTQLETAASSGRRNILDYLLSMCTPS